MNRDPMIPMLDLVRLHRPLKDALMRAFEEILDSGRFIGGETILAFEKKLASHIGIDACVGMSSGTDALLAALMTLGVGPGDEVITTGYSFVATAGSIVRLGATPVFVDINIDTFNIDPQMVEAAVTSRTVGIVPVHLFGQCIDMDPLLAVAKRHGLFVVEDAAQSLGATYKGQSAGTMGAAGVFSFFPAKNLGALGDGGAVVTRDPVLAKRLCSIREHGVETEYQHNRLGGNFRLDALQAAMLSVKLPYLKKWEAGRQRVADAYRTALRDTPGISLPIVKPDCHVVNNQFVVRSPYRDLIQAALRRLGIASAIYYPTPLYRQPCFESFVPKEQVLPMCDGAAETALALPIDPLLEEGAVARIVETIESVIHAEQAVQRMA